MLEQTVEESSPQTPLSPGLVSAHFAVIMDGGSMLVSVAMKVWRIKSVMRPGLPESGMIARCRKTRNTAITLKRPFRKTSVSVCFTRNLN